MRKMLRFAREAVTLGTARGRVAMWLLLSAVIFAVPYHWLDNLSLWKRLGWHSAPSIGLTRAYWLLIHGNPAGAWHRNWLIMPVCVIGLSVIALDVRTIVKKSTKRPKSSTLSATNT